MYLPITINLRDKKILIIGGGAVAEQKVSVLKQFTSAITIVAKVISPRLTRTKFHKIIDAYQPKYLLGFDLVFACTNDRAVNAKIKHDANKKHILVNVVDDPALCDFIMPAIYKKKEMTVAVSSGGKNVRKAIHWRDRIQRMDFV
jgi:siroheme synthase-like protein